MKRFLMVAIAAAFAFSSTASAQDEKKKKKREGRGSPEAAFKAMDADSDGKVTIAEFKEKAPGKMKERADQMFGRIDGNKDDSISLEEWKTFSERAKKKKDGEKKDPPKEDKKDPPKEDKKDPPSV